MPVPTIISLVYVSTARPGLDHDDLLAIEAVARRKNQESGISGLLLFNGFNFMQSIEGERTAVQDCLRRIERDDRHSGMTVVSQRETPRRQFAQWHMAGRSAAFQTELAEAGLMDLLSHETVAEATSTLFRSFLSFGIKAPAA